MVAGSGILAVSMAGGSWIGSSNTNLASCASAALMATFRDIWTSGQIICSALAAIIYIFVLVKIRLSRRRVIPKDGAKADAQTERDRKMTVMVTSMIACFMVTTVTANVLRQVYPYAENTYVKTAMSQMVGTLLLINSWVDLVIYTKKNEEIKVRLIYNNINKSERYLTTLF